MLRKPVKTIEPVKEFHWKFLQPLWLVDDYTMEEDKRPLPGFLKEVDKFCEEFRVSSDYTKTTDFDIIRKYIFEEIDSKKRCLSTDDLIVIARQRHFFVFPIKRFPVGTKILSDDCIRAETLLGEKNGKTRKIYYYALPSIFHCLQSERQNVINQSLMVRWLSFIARLIFDIPFETSNFGKANPALSEMVDSFNTFTELFSLPDEYASNVMSLFQDYRIYLGRGINVIDIQKYSEKELAKKDWSIIGTKYGVIKLAEEEEELGTEDFLENGEMDLFIPPKCEVVFIVGEVVSRPLNLMGGNCSARIIVFTDLKNKEWILENIKIGRGMQIEIVNETLGETLYGQKTGDEGSVRYIPLVPDFIFDTKKCIENQRRKKHSRRLAYEKLNIDESRLKHHVDI